MEIYNQTVCLQEFFCLVLFLEQQGFLISEDHLVEDFWCWRLQRSGGGSWRLLWPCLEDGTVSVTITGGCWCVWASWWCWVERPGVHRHLTGDYIKYQQAVFIDFLKKCRHRIDCPMSVWICKFGSLVVAQLFSHWLRKGTMDANGKWRILTTWHLNQDWGYWRGSHWVLVRSIPF